MTQADPELVDRVERTRDELRAEARARIGVTGHGGDMPPLREMLRRHGLSAYPLYALGVLTIVDTFQLYAFRVLAPDMSRTLGVSRGTIAAAIAVSTLAQVLGPLPIAALAQRRARRAFLVVVTGILWSLVAITTGYVTAMAGLLAVLVLDGFTTSSKAALHRPLLLDSYPPEGRVRVLTYYEGADQLGNVLAPLLVAVLAGVFGLTWRGVFLVMGLGSLAAALSALRLRDPGFGRWDTEQIRATVREHETKTESAVRETEGLSDSDVGLRFWEIVRRLLLIPSVRRLLVAQAVFGVVNIPLQVFLAFFLDERWNLGAGARGLFSAFVALVAIGALAAVGRRGESLFRRNPARVLEAAGAAFALAIGLICLGALSPWLPLTVGLIAVAIALIFAVAPGVNTAFFSVIPADMRAHGAALIGIAYAAGGLGGSLFLAGIDRRYGIVGSIVSLLVPAALGSFMLARAGRLVPTDLDRMIDETIEDEELRQLAASGRRLPMLACRNLDFSYGPVQVLFGVDFTVDDGEMVALLGTNGAGKSTLLKVISGIGLPSTGSVRFRGQEITYLDAERRLHLGITQVPGGRAVFGPLSVVENLRVFGYTMGRRRRDIDAAIERCFDAFPRLAERRSQKASTLSGGEQQMLGLSKALMLKPRLLLVDELSLGLAPVIVGQLLDLVRQINADGTAVVLVEQSVNIALGLVDHAYFMEKGEIRFDGPSWELLERADLLRAVFLEGAGRTS